MSSRLCEDSRHDAKAGRGKRRPYENESESMIRIGSLQRRVRTDDALTFISVPVLLGVVVLIASWIPARRATRVDPMVALRWE